MSRTAVYYHEDAAGEILYVGCSHSPYERFAGHRSTSRWVEQVANIRILWLETREQALAFERSEINRLKPKHNAEWRPKKSLPWVANEGQLYMQNWARKHGGSIERLSSNAMIPMRKAASYFEGLCHPNTKTKALLALATDGFVPQPAFDRLGFFRGDTPVLTFPTANQAHSTVSGILRTSRFLRESPVAKLAAARNSIALEASQ